MAIPKIFKKEKENGEKAKPIKKTSVGTVERSRGLAWKIIVKPYISEKSSGMEKEGKYVFEVSKGAGKKEIGEAITELYGVSVLSVNVINVPRKKKRLGRYFGWTKGIRKAIVKLKEGEKIDMISA